MEERERQRIKDVETGKGLNQNTGSSVGRGTATRGGAIRKVIAKSIPYTVDWKSVIKRYLRVADNAVKVWSKPGLKGLAGGYAQQGRIPNPNKLDAIFAIDTSGSVGQEQLEYACKIAKEMALGAKNLKVRIVLWHGIAYWISDVITSFGALDETIANITMEQGGTNMSSVAELLEKRNIKPYVTIYITDGYIEEGVPKVPPSKNLVVIVNNAARDEEFRANMAAKFAAAKAEVVATPELNQD